MDTIERLAPEEVEFQQELVRQQRDAQIALDVWAAFLRRKYGLKDHDRIQHDGIIVRAPDAQG